MNAKNEPSGVVVLSEVKDAASFRTYLDGELARLAKESSNGLNVRIIDDPMTMATTSSAPAKTAPAKVDAAKTELFVWIHNNIFAASPQIESLRNVATALNTAGASGFAGTPFNQRIKDIYKDGAGLVVAADLQKIVTQALSKDTDPGVDRRL